MDSQQTPQSPTAEQILDAMAREMGKTPEVMELLSKIKPSMVQEQARSRRFAGEDSSIPDKYRQLISIAAVAGAGSASCLKTQIAQALRQGIEPVEIVDALVVARFALASTVFSAAKDGLRILVDSLAEADVQDA